MLSEKVNSVGVPLGVTNIARGETGETMLPSIKF